MQCKQQPSFKKINRNTAFFDALNWYKKKITRCRSRNPKNSWQTWVATLKSRLREDRATPIAIGVHPRDRSIRIVDRWSIGVNPRSRRHFLCVDRVETGGCSPTHGSPWRIRWLTRCTLSAHIYSAVNQLISSYDGAATAVWRMRDACRHVTRSFCMKYAIVSAFMHSGRSRWRSKLRRNEDKKLFLSPLRFTAPRHVGAPPVYFFLLHEIHSQNARFFVPGTWGMLLRWNPNAHRTRTITAPRGPSFKFHTVKSTPQDEQKLTYEAINDALFAFQHRTSLSRYNKKKRSRKKLI
jgi:hypothetical protein